MTVGQDRHQGVFERLPGIVRALVTDHTPDRPAFKGLVITGSDRMRLGTCGTPQAPNRATAPTSRGRLRTPTRGTPRMCPPAPG